MFHSLQGLDSRVIVALDYEEFSKPNLRAPFDVEAFVKEVPVGLKIQGGVLAEFYKLGKGRIDTSLYKPFVFFKNYPGRESLIFLAYLAQLIFPFLPLREGLRHLGWQVFDIFRKTIIGRSIVDSVDGRLELMLSKVELAYKTQGEGVEVHCLEAHKRHVIFSFNRIYTFFDCFEVGVLEGAVKGFGEIPDVWLRLDSPYKGDCLIRW